MDGEECDEKSDGSDSISPREYENYCSNSINLITKLPSPPYFEWLIRDWEKKIHPVSYMSATIISKKNAQT